MSFIADLFKPAPKGYKPKNTEAQDQLSNERVTQRLGANSNPITGASGVAQATAGYEGGLGAINQAMAGYSKPTMFNQTYNPSSYNAANFDFAKLPQQYADTAFQSGAGRIQRQGNQDLAQLREGAGTRRPGLFGKFGAQAQRGTGEDLASLGSKIELEKMNKNIDLGKSQQLSQASENLGAKQFNAGEQFKGYTSRSDLEKANEENRLANLAGLKGAGESDLTAKSGLVENERAYQDKALEYIMKLFGQSAGIQNDTAQIATTNRGNSLSFMSNMAQAAGGAYGASKKG